MATNGSDPVSALAQALAAQQAFMLGQTTLANNISAQNSLMSLQQNSLPSSPLHSLSSIPQIQQASNFGLQMAMGQIMTDALKMIVPVGSSPNDEELLVQALVESEGKGQTYRSALDALHGVNNHAANLWKDYFLEHHQRIEAMVQTRRRPFSGAKKPSFRNDRRSHEPAPSSALSHSHSNSPDRTRHDLSSKEQGSSTSMKASYRSNGSKPHTSRKRSNTRLLSREPSPPTEVVPLQCGRFQYTQEEKDYFFRYVQWRYQQDPSVKKLQICEELYEKLPHHTNASWQSFWHYRRDEVDKVYDNLQEITGTSVRPIQVSEDDSGTPNGAGDPDYEDMSEESEEDTDSEDDVQNMSGPGESPTESDKRIMARYIASFDDWDALSNREKWGAFEQMYPQRNCKAWTELHRTRQREVNRLVRKYQLRKEKQQSIHRQVGRPTWAKRSRLDVDDSGARDSKRSRDSGGYQ